MTASFWKILLVVWCVGSQKVAFQIGPEVPEISGRTREKLIPGGAIWVMGVWLQLFTSQLPQLKSVLPHLTYASWCDLNNQNVPHMLSTLSPGPSCLPLPFIERHQTPGFVNHTVLKEHDQICTDECFDLEDKHFRRYRFAHVLSVRCGEVHKTRCLMPFNGRNGRQDGSGLSVDSIWGTFWLLKSHTLVYVRCGRKDFSCGSYDVKSCSHTPTTRMAPPNGLLIWEDQIYRRIFGTTLSFGCVNAALAVWNDCEILQKFYLQFQARHQWLLLWLYTHDR